MGVVMGPVRTPLPVSVVVVRTEPKYELYLDELDALVGRVFEATSVNPAFFLAGLQPRAREYLIEANAQCWAGQQALHPSAQSECSGSVDSMRS
jgi:hypothetical protein